MSYSSTNKTRLLPRYGERDITIGEYLVDCAGLDADLSPTASRRQGMCFAQL